MGQARWWLLATNMEPSPRKAPHLAGQKVVVKQLSALQNFGSMDVLYCDKTGTLTEGVMVLEQAGGGDGRASCFFWPTSTACTRRGCAAPRRRDVGRG
jgi:Mg2+-importing ATPase